ncbi:DUF2726 domain-containing protein [Pseudomonas aeruginosa]|nr:DUF2726 domain-containing protein [Pseudomonas aeruginosa]EKU7761483.1 DUF2726 domain-containing protein [Pseudomonas aeruginosa]EKX0410912.1 DUF2726 domain-containing protein [Pseudomonas aeruginosa]MBO8420511.1 DUF2726 domain-containing protein [Pseudomonas aeruginosa]MBO8420522.1 DUF2726 domain-containing protein [Pseudomonas aeruginosa]MBQ0241136.1 DUF2726 domain-containing protein [Pseudomonas aeruginosa]
MEPLLLAAAVVVVAALILAITMNGGSAQSWDGQWPFYAKRPLTKPEQVLYHRLIHALPDHIVLCQVQVSRVLGVKRGFKFNQWNNRINRLSYDFVICSKDASVIAAIELDDSTHQKAARQEADRRKDKATADAGVKMIRWNVKNLPDSVAIQEVVTPARADQKVIENSHHETRVHH